MESTFKQFPKHWPHKWLRLTCILGFTTLEEKNLRTMKDFFFLLV